MLFANRAALALAVLLAAGGALSAPAAAKRSLPFQPAPRGIAAPEELWHLRAGLNVAALSCRGSGRTGVAGHYSTLLARHRGVLAAAYQGEQSRHGGGAAFDRHQTRLYNRFALQRSPHRFCAAAADVAARANRLNSAQLGPESGRLLDELEDSLN